MKKKIKTFLLLGFCLLSHSCQKNDSFLMLSPTGSPSLAFYNFKNEEFETNTSPINVISNIRNNSTYGIVIAPTIAGIQAINREIKNNGKSDFKFASTITFGNFFLAGTGHDSNKILDDTDKVVIFNVKDEMPDLLFKITHGELYQRLMDNNCIYYVNNAQEAASALKTGKVISEEGGMIDIDYALCAEPTLYSALLENKNGYIYENISELYSQTGDNKMIFQGSVFVNTTKDHQKIDLILEKMKNDITNGVSNPSVIKNTLDAFGDTEMVKLKFGIPSSEIIKRTIELNNRLGLGYLKGKENISKIQSFVKDMKGDDVYVSEEIFY